MKRYVKSSESIEDLCLGTEVCVGQTWRKLITSIEENTVFVVDSVNKEHSSKWITLYDDYHNEYEAEVTRYSNGQYELRCDNIHKV